MKINLIILSLIFLPYLIMGQKVDNLQVKLRADSLYIITFDLDTDQAQDEFRIALIAKRGALQINPLSATGAGIYHPIPEGEGYRILWSPQKEGLDPLGWGIRLRTFDPNPQITKVRKPLSDYPLVIAASYVFMFTLLYVVNLIN